MTQPAIQMTHPIDALNRAFLLNYPRDAARKIETMPADQAAILLRDQPTYVLLPVWSNLAPGIADNLLPQLPDETATNLLSTLAAGQCASLLSRFDAEQRGHFLGLLDKSIADELRELLEYRHRRF
jgi:magnesium transporter